MDAKTTDTLPIGPLQHGMWLFWRLNPQSPSYSMPEIFHFDGEFDVAAAEFALNEVIRRHESLRTTFHETDAGVVQIIDRAPGPVPVNVVDLRGLSSTVQPRWLQSTIDIAANLPFDLTAEPPIRLTVLRVSDNRSTLVLVVHHIVCDGTSMSILCEEFGELYRSARRGTEPDIGPIAPGYGTFVREQLDALAEGKLEEEAAFWREQLAGVRGSVLPGADRAAERQPDELDTYTVSVTLDDELAAALLEYARNAKSTPFSVLLTAMKVMLAVATGESDHAVGTATSGRTPKYARTVGALANMVVARSQIDMTASFADMLDEVSFTLMDAIDHQDLPLSRIVTELHDAGHQPGADIVRTVFTAGSPGTLTLGEGRVSDVIARTVEGPFDLFVACDFSPAGVALDWEYALRTYSREAADNYCAAYQKILAVLLSKPDATLDSLGLVELLGAAVAASQPEVASTSVESPAAEPETAAEPTAEPIAETLSPLEPLTPVEEAVAAVWSEVLGVPVQSPDDDFFVLGGHSMLASEVVAMVRKSVSRTATLRLLFDHPELGDFASHLDVPADADLASGASGGTT